MREFETLIDLLLEKNAAFACWFQPSEEGPQLIVGSARDVFCVQDFNALSELNGFVFAPFSPAEKTPVIVVKPGLYLQGYQQIQTLDRQMMKEFSFSQSKESSSRSTAFDEYLKCVRNAIAQIAVENFSKVIVSRCICREKKNESMGRLFREIHRKNADTFVFAVNLPQAGFWMGATPELLLRSDGMQAETVSLAATQPRRSDSQYCWRCKEIEEQAFVSRYTVDVLHRFGFSHYRTKGPEDLETATVAHLKTTFFFPADSIEKRLGMFVEDLYPTPAVCGLPKREAARFIQTFEPHDRAYYTGFLGPWRLGGAGTDLYVNLRSMKIEKSQYVLYSGGGITARSMPEQEWQETSQKARTLLNAIEAVQGRL